VSYRHLIVAIDAVACAAALGALGLSLLRPRTVLGPGRYLLAVIPSILFLVAGGNVFEWAALVPETDLVEDFLLPLLPVLWLFVYLVEIEWADRRRVRQGYERLVAVHGLADKLGVTMEPRAIMEEVIAATARLFQTPCVVLTMPEGEDGHLAVRAHRGLTEAGVEPQRLTPGQGLTYRAFLEKQPQRTSDVQRDAGPMWQPVVPRLGIRYAAGVPLLLHNRAVGVLSVGRSAGGPFDDDDIRVLETLCAHAAVAIENARLYEQLGESEARYRMLVENARVAIAVVGADRRISFWNRGAERLFGWTAEEAIGQHIERIYPPEKRADVPRDILQDLHKDGYWHGEYPAIRKDGSRFTASLSLARVFAADGHVICALGVILDVTEEVRLREQLLEVQKMETIGQLAGGVAHDFNNLLTAVLGFASLLRASLPPGTDDHESVLGIEQAAQRGSQLVRQLLAFSHRHTARSEPIDLNDVVREVVGLIRRTFPESIQVATRLAPDLGIVCADPTQMHQVVMNLAVNARDAMPRGGRLDLTTERVVFGEGTPPPAALKTGPWVRLAIADTGEGIPPSVQPHIFEPFFSTKSQGRGTGLGLSTAYAIVRRLGGRLAFRTEAGRGTTFEVLLPAAENPDCRAP